MPLKNLEKNYVFYTLVSIGILLHLMVFTLPLFDDATAWGNTLTLTHVLKGWLQNQHLPPGIFFYYISALIFGITDFALRVVPLLFNMLSIALLFVLAKRWYNL